MVGFISDNVSGIHPAIMEALLNENTGYRMPYGDDELSKHLDSVYSDMFGTEVIVLPCTSGTAANALALSLMAGPINSICAHKQSHLYVDECNAPEFFSGGARLNTIDGDNGKISLAGLKTAVAVIGEAHSPQPSVISITQTTEIGSNYSIEEVKQVSAFAKEHGLKLHMDGARFANALATLNCHPADISWKAGVDALSFGATKNGCLAAEAIVLFDKTLIREARHRVKRAGQLISKQRFLAAQLHAYLEDDLWLKNAKHANEKVQVLVRMLSEVEGVELPESIESNILFARFTAEQNARLQAAGLAGYLYDTGHMRLCCSWATSDDELQQFVDCVSDSSS